MVDEVVDEGNQKTGRQVSTNNKDKCIILISGFDLPTQTVKRLTLVESEIIPGSAYRYQYKNTTYNLHATGKKMSEYPNSYFHNNYRLFCRATIKGKTYDQLLVAHAQSVFGSNILFAGDIDGDGIPDLLINTTNQEGTESPSLYLSKFAGKGNLFKIAGRHTISGC